MSSTSKVTVQDSAYVNGSARVGTGTTLDVKKTTVVGQNLAVFGTFVDQSSDSDLALITECRLSRVLRKVPMREMPKRM